MVKASLLLHQKGLIVTSILKFTQADKTIFTDGFIQKSVYMSGSEVKLLATTYSEVEELDLVVEELKKHNAFLSAWEQSARMFPEFFIWPANGVNCKYDLLPDLEKSERLQSLGESEAFFICSVWRFCYSSKASELLCEWAITKENEKELFNLFTLSMKNIYKLLEQNASPWTS